MLHNTVFHGKSLYEPLQVEARFSTILPDRLAPVISIDLPRYFGESKEHSVPVTITEENFGTSKYMIDGESFTPKIDNGSFKVLINAGVLAEGIHTLRIDTSDLVGHAASFESRFEVDNTPPSIDAFVNDSSGNLKKVTGSRVGISRESTLIWNMTDKNGIVTGTNFQFMGNHVRTAPNLISSVLINPAVQLEGAKQYSFKGEDASGNSASREIEVIVDTLKPTPSLSIANTNPQDLRGAATMVLSGGDSNIESMFLQVGTRKGMNVTGMSEYNLDTTEFPDGEYDLKLVAKDIAGNEGTIVLPVVVANYAPSITLAIIAGVVAGGGIASITWLIFGRQGRRAVNKS